MGWSIKYKRSINCKRPKGFSQKQYCRRQARGGRRLSGLGQLPLAPVRPKSEDFGIFGKYGPVIFGVGSFALLGLTIFYFVRQLKGGSGGQPPLHQTININLTGREVEITQDGKKIN